jgi:toxin ParE1/3/4
VGILRISLAARQDLSTIYRHGVEAFGQRQADRYIDGLLDTLDLLADFPEMARVRDSLNPPARVHGHLRHVIVYDLLADEIVLIVRIRHALEDWQGLSGDMNQ